MTTNVTQNPFLKLTATRRDEPQKQEQTAAKTDLFASMIFCIRGEFFEVIVHNKAADEKTWKSLKDHIIKAISYQFTVNTPKKMEFATFNEELHVSDTKTIVPLNSQYSPAILQILNLFKETIDSEVRKKTLVLHNPSPKKPSPNTQTA
jgi:hypothetical protein